MTAGGFARGRTTLIATVVLFCALTTSCSGSSPAPADAQSNTATQEWRRLSGASPFPTGCGASLPDPGSGLTSDIAMAISPQDPRRIAVAWMQDARADTTAYAISAAISTDGGQRFETFPVPGLGVCSGGDRAVVRDPDLAFGADGVLYLGAVTSGASTLEPTAVVMARSHDGGMTWSPFTTIEDSGALPEQIYAVDRTVLAADRSRPGTAYVMYMRLIPNLPLNNAIVISRTLDGGTTWSAPSTVAFLPGASSTIGSLLSLTDGSLLHVYRVIPATGLVLPLIELITGIPVPLPVTLPPSALIVASRSTDMGATWSTPVFIGAHEFPGYAVSDADTGLLIDYLVLRAAVAPDGTVYAAWQNRPGSDGMHTISLSRSGDGGRSWSAPAQILSEPRPNFQPSFAVGADGTLGLTFYDQRSDASGGEASLADVWFRSSTDGGQTWIEQHLAGPFDMRSTVTSDGASMNVGNPQAFQGFGLGFAAAFNVGRPLATEADMAVVFQTVARPN